MIWRIVHRGFNELKGSWKIIWICRRQGRNSKPDRGVVSPPANRMVPEVMGINFRMALPTVVLPLPLSPTKPTVFPARTVKLQSVTGLIKSVRRWRIPVLAGNQTFRESISRRSGADGLGAGRHGAVGRSGRSGPSGRSGQSGRYRGRGRGLLLRHSGGGSL